MKKLFISSVVASLFAASTASAWEFDPIYVLNPFPNYYEELIDSHEVSIKELKEGFRSVDLKAIEKRLGASDKVARQAARVSAEAYSLANAAQRAADQANTNAGLALALGLTALDLTRSNSVSGSLGVDGSGETFGAIRYNRGLGNNWDVGIGLATDGTDYSGGVHVTYSWD